ncbi:VOC family protein [Thauera humireducens]|uniref:VOC family protein n=1 Tax=Thauera humireducens TaxID=1134435 RepID=UPI00311F4DCB
MCNAWVSDWIGPSPLLRIDDVHHRIALFPTDRSGIQHINHQVESVDDIMRSWYFLQERGVPVVFGPGRHPTSGARFILFRRAGRHDLRVLLRRLEHHRRGRASAATVPARAFGLLHVGLEAEHPRVPEVSPHPRPSHRTLS